jgi:hypothetical protein
MTPQRLLQFNAFTTAASALAMLGTREWLPGRFGLSTPTVLDGLAFGLLVYAGLLVVAARRRPVGREVLMAFTIVEGVWIAATVIVLFAFWPRFDPLARLLLILGALVVDVFATLQFRAAGAVSERSPQAA